MTSGRRRARLRYVGGVSALVAVVSLSAWSAVRRAPPGPAPNPGRLGIPLCVGFPAETRADVVWSKDLVSALALSLEAASRERLQEALDNASARWERRANPLFEDFDEGSPDKGLVEWFASAPPAAILASIASRRQWCGTDGFCVRLASSPTGCTGEFRPPLSASEQGRARFLAWPFGYALVLGAASAPEARAMVETLRAHAGSSKYVGLVLHAEDANRLNSKAATKLSESFQRYQAWRTAAASEVVNGPPIPSWNLPPEIVVVLPAIAVLSDPSAFETEVRRLLPEARLVTVRP